MTHSYVWHDSFICEIWCASVRCKMWCVYPVYWVPVSHVTFFFQDVKSRTSIKIPRLARILFATTVHTHRSTHTHKHKNLSPLSLSLSPSPPPPPHTHEYTWILTHTHTHMNYHIACVHMRTRHKAKHAHYMSHTNSQTPIKLSYQFSSVIYSHPIKMRSNKTKQIL